jgi:subtilisin family serine protease
MIITILLLATSGYQPAQSAPSSESIRVMIQYKAGGKGTLQSALNSAGAQIHYEFDSMNTLALTLPTQALQGITNNPNVVLIEQDPPRYFSGSLNPTASIAPIRTGDNPYETQVVPYGVDMVQARQVWDADEDGVVDEGAFTGQGVTVCIIDTGLYIQHEDLAGVNVIGGYDYRNNAPWDEDVVGHGTHVAGTITAMNNSQGVVGVTPGTVNLYIVRTFNDNGDWIWTSTLVDASNRCANAGADIISMSLSGSTSSSSENTAFQNHYNNGILSIAAASNEGTSAYHYPASYDSVISVGAIDINMNWATFSNFNNQVEVAAPGVGVLSTVPFIERNTVTVAGSTYYGNHLENTARGTESGVLADGGLCGSTNVEWSDKVVLCERGDYSFAEKVLNVQNSGGVAALLYNNVPGNFLGTLDPSTSTIIGLSLTQEDGQYLLTNHLGENAFVESQEPTIGSGYEAWDGTSMATPHVAGVAALVWSCDPSATNVEVRNALTATAYDLGTIGRDNYYGYGLVQALDACQSLNPTAIELISFTSDTTQNAVILTWETASEVDLAGFNIYRAESPEGERIKINPSIIPSASPGGMEGATYEHLDSEVVFGVPYIYWLEAVDLDLRVKDIFGPASALWWKAYLPILVTE